MAALPELDDLSVLRVVITVDDQEIHDVRYAGGSSITHRLELALSELRNKEDALVQRVFELMAVRESAAQ